MLAAMSGGRAQSLSTPSAIALYVGALLGPSLMLLPGLEAQVAGPASIVAWAVVIVLSAGLASVFAGLGIALPRGGVAAYARAGFGPLAGRVVKWCFIVGVLLGTPFVGLIGGSYFASLFGFGRVGTTLCAAALLAAIVVLVALGTRVGMAVQLGLVTVLVLIAIVAAVASIPHASAENWQPFAPHGWGAIGSSAAAVAMAFFGWEAIAPFIERLRAPRRQLPMVIATAFAVTAVIYLAVVIATIGVLGDRSIASSLAALLRVAVGRIGPVLAAVIAVALTLAAANAYLNGTIATIAAPDRSGQARTAVLAVAVAGGTLGLTAYATGLVDLQLLVQFPAALSLVVYVLCVAAAARRLTGWIRLVAIGCLPLLVALLAFTTYALVAPLAVVAVVLVAAAVTRRRRPADRVAEPVGTPGLASSQHPAAEASLACAATAPARHHPSNTENPEP